MIEQYQIDELSRVAGLPELATGKISKATALAALSAIAAAEKIAAMPIGNNALAEVQRMRDIATRVTG